MNEYILSIDQGTTSSRAMLFDSDGRACFTAQREFTQHFPRDGWVEHDAEEIWSTTLGVVGEALEKAKADSRPVAAIGITNQRETTVVWDRASGKPVYNAIVWQDRRTAEYCERLRGRITKPRLRAKHRAAARPLLLRHQDRLDTRQRGRARANAPSAANSRSAPSTAF